MEAGIRRWPHIAETYSRKRSMSDMARPSVGFGVPAAEIVRGASTAVSHRPGVRGRGSAMNGCRKTDIQKINELRCRYQVLEPAGSHAPRLLPVLPNKVGFGLSGVPHQNWARV